MSERNTAAWLRALSIRRDMLADAQREVRTGVLAAVRAGVPVTEVAAAAGVHRVTVHRWLREHASTVTDATDLQDESPDALRGDDPVGGLAVPSGVTLH